MSCNATSFISDLAAQFEPLHAALAEHKEENFDAILPHLAMADFCRIVCDEKEGLLWVSEFLTVLEKNFLSSDDDEISNLIAVSFVENLSSPTDGCKVIATLPPRLKSQYHEFFGF